MLFPLNKIELCTANGKDARYYLQHVHLDVEGKRLLATNCHIAVVLPVEPEPTDISGPISLDCIKDARKQDSVIKLGVAGVLSNGAAYPRPDAPMAANIDAAIPAQGGQTIAFDAELLYRLAQALGAGKTKSYIRLYVPTDKFTAIRVEPISGAGYGAICGCR